MTTIILFFPIFVVVFALGYGITRGGAEAWMRYRIRMRLLNAFERHPDLVPPYEELSVLVEKTVGVRHAPKHHWGLVGVFLGIWGAAGMGWGYATDFGRLSSGIYAGGAICLCLGFLIALGGIAARGLARRDNIAGGGKV